MSTVDTSIRVVVEPSVILGPEGKARKARQFRYFRASGRKKGMLVSESKGEQRDGKQTAKVLSISKPSDMKKLGAGSVGRQATLAVTSAKVFNEPRLRTMLSDANVEVFVHEQGNLELQELAPWLERMTDTPDVMRVPAAEEMKAAEENVLSLSKRLREPKTGRLDARKLSELLGITMSDIATRVCGVSKQALNQSPFSPGIQDSLKVLEDIVEILHWCGGDEEKLRAWLNRPNRDFAKLEGKVPSPRDLILLGHSDIVAGLVWNLRTGHPS